MVRLTIDGREANVPEGTSILDAAESVGVFIPTLCYYRELNEIGACRVCVVEVEGQNKLYAACNNKVTEGMAVHTNTLRVQMARRTNVALLLAEHDSNCALCVRSGNCCLQTLANEMNLREIPYEKILPEKKPAGDFPLIRNNQKCIKCMRCIQVCDKIQDSRIWDVCYTGSRASVDVTDVYRLEDSNCALCGQCITHCPVGALNERDDTDKVIRAIADPDKITLVQIAPAIRTSWGESFGLPAEEATVERLAACLKDAGIDYVFDTNFAADMTIVEEANEFLEKAAHMEEAEFPMFTSCCPGWVRYAKAHHPDFVSRISTSKSPQQMFGPIAKTWYAEKLGVDPERIFCISVMPCLAKKQECDLPTMNDAGAGQDVDVSLTTREVVRLLKMTQTFPEKLKDVPLDAPLGLGTGAAVIFGATGGVMEAALRSAYYYVTGELPDPDQTFVNVRGMDGWKEAEYELPGLTLKVAVVNGLGNAGKLLRALRKGKVFYHFVEVMACPGGCVGGGGQPIHDGFSMAASRAEVLYDLDQKLPLRFSHENPAVIDCYQQFLEKPLSEKAEKLLHTDHKAWKMPFETD